MNKAEEMGHEKLRVTMPTLDETEFRRVKISDAMEMWETGCVDSMMGNAYGSIVAQNALAAGMLRCRGGELNSLNRWVHEQGRKD
jgi:mannose/cellobiose epimerase-like protein (N-acyl-D-glucosamine 2-epimerase family)